MNGCRTGSASGAAVTSNGMLLGGTLGAALTIPLVLPLVGQSWRLDLVGWAAPVLMTALLFLLLVPPAHGLAASGIDNGRRWWPDWTNPLVWLLGLTFGSNNAVFFGVNAFLPDYLASIGRGDLTGAALGWLSGSQLIASTLLLATARHLQRQAWPFLVFGPATLAGVLGILGRRHRDRGCGRAAGICPGGDLRGDLRAAGSAEPSR
jgi:MFS transporter, CP family, cyanate transporter